MKNLSVNQLLREKPVYEQSNVGTASRGNIRKDGRFYHVITTSWRKRWLYDSELALYRKDLLNEECIKHGVTILFSVTMPTHTHDVFITPDWETIAEVIRIVNSSVSKYVRRHMPERMKNRSKVLSEHPAYVIINDIVQLFVTGKYLYKNYSYLKDENKAVPDSCFWMFEKNYFSDPYNGKLYKQLFGMEPKNLLDFYANHSDAEIKMFCDTAFSEWTEEDNKRLFFRKP